MDDPSSDRDLSPMVPDEVPQGYPRDLEHWVDLPDGERIFIRPVVPQDVARLAYAFAHADLDTLRRRFFTAAPPADRQHLEYLATVDYQRRLALLATDRDGTSIGIGRYEAGTATDETGVAEVAIVVAPAWRRRGVGSALLCALEAPAARHGFASLAALYLPSNRAVEALLRSLGYGDRVTRDGISVVTKSLGVPVPSDGCTSPTS
jgi:GNAT superfamily N-acetyltransferase